MIQITKEGAPIQGDNEGDVGEQSLGTETSMFGNAETTPDAATTNSSEFSGQPDQSVEKSAPEALVGTGQFLEYVDTDDQAVIVAECGVIVDSLFALHGPEDIPKHKKWCEDRNSLIESLKDSGISQDELEECRMYHVLIGSTPSKGTIHRFDLANSDEIINFIKKYKERNHLS